MTQIEVWDQTVEETGITGMDLVIYWADRLSSLCEYMNVESRIGNMITLFPLMEKVSDRYSEARNNVAKAEENV